jgi:hypothetical protein
LYLIIAARLLLFELIARKGKNLEAAILVVSVQGFQALVLWRQPALAGDIHDKQQPSFVVGQWNLTPVSCGRNEVVRARHDFPLLSAHRRRLSAPC